ncbi:hypothetical protein WJM97_14390 [Okeanomitos corallinicola TIOX110]|uniref:Uncharacterized protein n=1 Tax=Okeanomitos corallinicola TIOX110 TaxID=3133117 RepID=A0ABZ2UMI6_9CYAN
MKCINCGTDNNLQDRTANQGRCKQCNHPFAFEPTSMGTVKITDPMFAKILADISVNNTLYFTPKQLLYFLDNRLRKKAFQPVSFVFLYLFFNIWVTLFFGGMTSAFLPNSFIIVNLIYQAATIFYLFNNTKSSKLNNSSRKSSAKTLIFIGIVIIVVGIFISLSLNSFPIFCTVVILGMLSTFLGTRQLGKVGNLPQEFLVPQSNLEGWLERWQQLNGKIEQLLHSPQERIAPASVNPDVTAYSFDRLIVCDSATIAQILIANNFHFENNCAILSVTGYPQTIFATTMEMLRRNPNLQVFAFHDCSPKGVSLLNHLLTSENWFLNSNLRIIDLGLLPRQILASKRGMFVQNAVPFARKSQELPTTVRQSLSAEELAWLDAGNFVELESFTPQMLIKVLQSGISGSLNLASHDSDLMLVDDSGNDIYIVESFG